MENTTVRKHYWNRIKCSFGFHDFSVKSARIYTSRTVAISRECIKCHYIEVLCYAPLDTQSIDLLNGKKPNPLQHLPEDIFN